MIRTLKSTYESEMFYGIRTSPPACISLVILCLILLAVLFASWVAPYNTLDLSGLDLLDSELPPSFVEGGEDRFVLGTDDQGRDLLSALIYGSRFSFIVASGAVLLSLIFGVVMGLLAGYFGGWIDALIMRLVDIQLALPSILLALLVNGIAIVLVDPQYHEKIAIPTLIIAIAIATWVNYARTVRSCTLVEVKMEYIQASKLAGFGHAYIIARHILPNVAGSIFVLATLDFATCILLEAALSFLGVGLPPTTPSLGTLIRVGSDYLFSGQWWVVFFSSLTLFVIVVCINLLGDRLRDILNPKLR